MPVLSVADLMEILDRQQLLEPEQLAALSNGFADPKALARELLKRGWLTAYQANHLLQGKAADLILGNYVLLERLGEGGMGAVYKARHRTLGRTVAVKVIRKERLANPDAVRRFRREIKAAAQLNHPNIVRAFDADEVGGTHLLVMEYVAGTDLAKLVKQQGPLPIAQACDYVRQTALGLQHALEKGLVHRDIKPANLLLSSGGVVKILDMGLARAGRADEDSEASSTMTQEGAVMGSPDYIAPEQALESHTVDIRADLYSLGCSFYQLLTGRVPFPTGTLLQKFNKHQFEEPTPVEQLRPEVPPAVAAIVRKLMAKRPADRFQTPDEVAHALASGGRPPPEAASPRGPDAPRSPEPAAFASLTADDTVTESLAARKARREAEKRRWVWYNACGGGVLVVLLALLVFLFTRSGTPTVSPTQVAANLPSPAPASGPAGQPGPAGDWQPLFNGKDLDGWTKLDGSPADWKVQDGYLEIAPGKGNIRTKQDIGPNFELHVEFWIPLMPAYKGQARGNSGVFLQGRHEIQIVDAHDNNPGGPTQTCGALYGVIGVTPGGIRPPETWQTFDITFQAPQGQTPGRLTVIHNGVKVIDDQPFQSVASSQALDNRTGAPGPIMLQDHGAPLRFRNILIRNLSDPAAPPPDGFQRLFNGKDLANWEVKQGPPEAWSVRDGLLGANGMRGMLGTIKTYRDFTLRLEWRIQPGANSGIYVRIPAVGNPITDSMEVQISDDKVPGPRSCGSLYNLVAPNRNPFKGAGEWNLFEITCRGDQLTVAFNGDAVLDVDLSRDPQLARRSKEGYIGLQSQIGTVEFRNIVIKDLTGQAAAPLPDGFEPLFNGKALSGFRKVGVADDTFQVVNGEIRCTGKPPGYLVTEKSYRNYHLRCELKHTEAAGNSGVLLHIQPPDKVWPQCMEAQAAQKNMGTLLAVGGARILSLSDSAQRNNVMKPVGQWNVYEVISKDGWLTTIVNGTQISKTFQTLTEGPIGWQSEGSEVWFRNILITDFDAKPAANAWQPLFNGRNLDGWEGTGYNPENIKETYTVAQEDGEAAIRSPGPGRLHLVTRETFENYHLRMQYKLAAADRDRWLLPGGGRLVTIRYHRPTTSAAHACKIDIPTGPNPGAVLCLAQRTLDTAALVGGSIEVRQKDVQLVPLAPDARRPEGEWNTLEIICLGRATVHRLNGRVVCVTANCRETMSNGVSVPVTSGAISLGVSQGDIFFRRIEIKPITDWPEEVKK